MKERIIHKNGGMRFPGLITVHDEIQKKLFKKKNDLLWVMDWAIYKFLHESAKHSNIIYPHDINREYLQQVLKKTYPTLTRNYLMLERNIRTYYIVIVLTRP